jgi:protein SCO1
MRRKWLIYSLFFATLAIGFLVALFWGTDKWKKKLPLLEYAKSFSFVDQQGRVFNERSLEGKVYVAEFFFTTCKGICPVMNGNASLLYAHFKDVPDFAFVSFTCMPEVDSVPVLKRYADSLQVNHQKWLFVTGDKLALYNTARNYYHIDDPKNNVGKIEDQFLHSQFWALVDRSGNVRGEIYDGLKPSDIDKLKKDIDELLQEPAGSTKSLHSLFNNNPQ